MPYSVSIIVYLHLCQEGPWQHIFDIIMNAMRSSGLYDACIEIRVGIVNNAGYIMPDSRFNDPKIVLVVHAPSDRYERATLEHMREYSKNEETQYVYMHSKGISHINGPNQHTSNCVMDWLKLLLHWNVTHWVNASNNLMKHDIYGCEYSSVPNNHYSGNFWWANSGYIRTLPERIGGNYCDPEFWIFQRENILWHNCFSSGHAGGGLYFNRCIKGQHY